MAILKMIRVVTKDRESDPNCWQSLLVVSAGSGSSIIATIFPRPSGASNHKVPDNFQPHHFGVDETTAMRKAVEYIRLKYPGNTLYEVDL